MEELQFRWALAISFEHFCLMFLMLMRSQLSKILNEGAWLLKILFVLIIGMMMMFLLPNGLLKYLHNISTYLSILWYLFQNLVIIDLIYGFENFFK